MSFTHFIYVGLMCFHSFLRARFQWFYLEFQVFSWHLWHYEVIKRLPKVDVKRNMKDFLFHNCVVKYIVFWGGTKVSNTSSSNIHLLSSHITLSQGCIL